MSQDKLTDTNQKELVSIIEKLANEETTTLKEVQQKISFYCRFGYLQPEKILSVMTKVSGFTTDQIKGDGREGSLPMVRFAIIHYLFQKGAADADIGIYFNNRVRGTIIYSRNTFKKLLTDKYSGATKLYDEFLEELKKAKLN